MRKLVVTFFMFALMLGGPSLTAYAVCGEDTPVDRAVDWLRTFGKKGMEKNQILARHKANRLLACAREKAAEAAKEVRKSNKDMKKRLGIA